MPLTYAPNGSTYHSAPRVLSGDDDQHEASYNVCLGDAYDNIAWVKSLTELEMSTRETQDDIIKGSIPGWGPTLCEVNLADAFTPPAGWAPWGVFGPPVWIQTDFGTGYALFLPVANAIPKLDGRTSITSLSCILRGASGHAALPEALPNITLVSIARNTLDPTTLTYHGVEAAAPPAGLNVTMYEQPTLFSLTLAEPVTYTHTRIFGIRVVGEHGTNSVAGLRLQAARVGVAYVPEF
jgi:hypothetical protein